MDSHGGEATLASKVSRRPKAPPSSELASMEPKSTLEETFPLHNNRLIRLLLRTGLVISTVVVALTFPFFGYVMAFIGSFFNVSISILFPCLCYLKIYRASRSFGVELVLTGAIIVMRASVVVLGTYTSVRQIVEHLHRV